MNRVIAVPGCAARREASLCNTLGPVRLGLSCVVILASVISVGWADEPLPSAPYTVRFSPDGRRLAIATGKPDSKVALTVWDTTTLRRLWVVRDRQGVLAVAFAPDGLTLAIGCFGEEARVFDSIAGKLRRRTAVTARSRVLSALRRTASCWPSAAPRASSSCGTGQTELWCARCAAIKTASTRWCFRPMGCGCSRSGSMRPACGR